MTENLPTRILTVRSMLAENMEVIKSSIPKHMNPERMLRLAFTSIQNNENLGNCTPQSLVAAVVEASQLGLEIDGRGLAYLVPFKSTAQLIVGYKGKLELAYRSKLVKNIYAEIVYEEDEFDVQFGSNPYLIHKPDVFGDRGKKIGVYAVAEMVSGAIHFEVMSEKEVDKIRKVSKTDKVWKPWENEMWRKTVLHRLSKMIPSSPLMQRASMIEDQHLAGIPQTLAPEISLIGVDGVPNGADDIAARLEAAKTVEPTDEPTKNPTGSTSGPEPDQAPRGNDESHRESDNGGLLDELEWNLTKKQAERMIKLMITERQVIEAAGPNSVEGAAVGDWFDSTTDAMWKEG